MEIIIVKNNVEAGFKAASLIASKIIANPKVVLGLATGSTPITTYTNLVEMNNAKKVDFSQVTTFNLDEYAGLEPTHEQSYRYFMNKQLFDKVNISKVNTFIPNGLDLLNPSKYDDLISEHGGIDFQLLGLGINGHIGFNEPGTSFDSLTSLVDLTQSTIEVNAKKFFNGDLTNVPTKAISMGLKSIINAKEILLIATGMDKAEAVKHLVEGPVEIQWPCSILLQHQKVTLIIDEEAASQLNKWNIF